MIRTVILGGWAMPQSVYNLSAFRNTEVFDYGFFDAGTTHLRMPSKSDIDGKTVIAHSMGTLVALDLIERGAKPAKLVIYNGFAKFTSEEGVYDAVPPSENIGMSRLLSRSAQRLLDKFYKRCAGTGSLISTVPECINLSVLEAGLEFLGNADFRHVISKNMIDCPCEVYLSTDDPLLTDDMKNIFRNSVSCTVFNVFSNSHLPCFPTRAADNFNRAADKYDDNAPFQLEAAESFISFITESCHPDRITSVFEAGCGTGALTERLEKLFPEAAITASDISGRMLSSAREKSLSADFVVADFDHAKAFPEMKFDLVVSSMALQWAESLKDTLEELVSLLENDGKLMFTIPLAGTYMSLRKLFESYNAAYPGLALPSMEELKKILESMDNITFEIRNAALKRSFPSLRSFLGTIRASGTANASHERAPHGILKKMILEHSGSFDTEYSYGLIKIQKKS